MFHVRKIWSTTCLSSAMFQRKFCGAPSHFIRSRDGTYPGDPLTFDLACDLTALTTPLSVLTPSASSELISTAAKELAWVAAARPPHLAPGEVIMRSETPCALFTPCCVCVCECSEEAEDEYRQLELSGQSPAKSGVRRSRGPGGFRGRFYRATARQGCRCSGTSQSQ